MSAYMVTVHGESGPEETWEGAAANPSDALRRAFIARRIRCYEEDGPLEALIPAE